MTLEETKGLVTSLAESTAMGHDLIDSIAIKLAAPLLIRPIQHLINTSLMKGKFSRKWKFSRLTPRLKNKELNRTLTSSYRPVAVLTTSSKLVERAAQQQLLNFLEQTNQLNKSNHAYRRNMSTTTTLIEILDELYQGVEDKDITSLMALDQSAAFDCVCPKILIDKMRLYNIGDDALNWVQDYLTGRTEYVILGGAQSKMHSVTRGVPQGSVIRPLLYALYTNKITEVVKSPGCQDPSHLDNRQLFGKQCKICGILSIYADDSTLAVNNSNRARNQLLLSRNLDELRMFTVHARLKTTHPSGSGALKF